MNRYAVVCFNMLACIALGKMLSGCSLSGSVSLPNFEEIDRIEVRNFRTETAQEFVVQEYDRISRLWQILELHKNDWRSPSDWKNPMSWIAPFPTGRSSAGVYDKMGGHVFSLFFGGSEGSEWTGLIQGSGRDRKEYIWDVPDNVQQEVKSLLRIEY